jgi:hypothetical protein
MNEVKDMDVVELDIVELGEATDVTKGSSGPISDLGQAPFDRKLVP